MDKWNVCVEYRGGGACTWTIPAPSKSDAEITGRRVSESQEPSQTIKKVSASKCKG